MSAGPGLGGTPDRPAGYTPPDQPGIAPGAVNVVRAREVIVSGTGGGVGVFVYAGTAGPGNNPVFAAVPPGVTVDPFGNPVTSVVSMGNAAGSHISVDQFGELIAWNNAGQLTMFLQPGLESFSIYNPPAGAGALAASLAAAAVLDNFSNNLLAGAAAYATTIATNLAAGVVNFYNGTQAGGWTLRATIQTDVGGDLLLATTGAGTIQLASATVAGSTLTVAGDCQMQSTAEVSGTLTVGNGSAASIVLNPKMATPPNLAAVVAGTATLAQTEACLAGIVQSMQNRGLVN